MAFYLVFSVQIYVIMLRLTIFESSPIEVFLGKGALQILAKFQGELLFKKFEFQ